jgi:hypothetical protein
VAVAVEAAVELEVISVTAVAGGGTVENFRETEKKGSLSKVTANKTALGVVREVYSAVIVAGAPEAIVEAVPKTSNTTGMF